MFSSLMERTQGREEGEGKEEGREGGRGRGKQSLLELEGDLQD